MENGIKTLNVKKQTSQSAHCGWEHKQQPHTNITTEPMPLEYARNNKKEYSKVTAES
jgi:hypothetical protein